MKNSEKNKIIRRILELCKINNITIYRLAINADIPRTTLSNMIRNNTLPTIPTIEKICKGFDITLAQFFMSDEIFGSLTSEQSELLELWELLNKEQKIVVKAYLYGLTQRNLE